MLDLPRNCLKKNEEEPALPDINAQYKAKVGTLSGGPDPNYFRLCGPYISVATTLPS